MNNSDSEKIIRGIVIPTEWDEKGNVVSIAISSFDENDYLVEKNKTSGQLPSLLRQFVEVTGIVKEKDGMKKIKITKYRLKNKEENFDIY